MDSASLPVILAPQSHTAATAAASSEWGSSAAGDGFAAILGATGLADLTAEQQGALAELLSDPARAVPPGGKISPLAAIRHLLEDLGLGLDTITVAEAPAGPAGPSAGLAEKGTGGADGAEPTTLLELLGPLVDALRSESRVVPPRPAAGDCSGATTVQPPMAPLLAPVAGLVTNRPGGGLEEQTAAVEPSGLALIERLLRAVNGKGESAPPPGSSAFPTVAGAEGAQPADAAMPLPTFTRVESLVDALTDAARVPRDAGGGLGAALDATLTPAGRPESGPAPGLVPPRAQTVATDIVSVPIHERGWDRSFADKIVWLVGQQIHAADVKLNPPHLGPVEVRLSLNGQDASVSFTVTHGAARDAIEQAVPRLRELFAEHQLQIVNVDVGQRDSASQASPGERWGDSGSRAAGGPAGTDAAESEPAARIERRGLPGLVDEYV